VAIFPASGFPGGRIELLQATSPDSPIARHIDKRGEGLHHLCIYVNDIERKLAELKAVGFELIDESPRVGAEGNRIAFVHPRDASGVLIELEERRGTDALAD
jgi:methylmalonyl-CoA epimerase